MSASRTLAPNFEQLLFDEEALGGTALGAGTISVQAAVESLDAADELNYDDEILPTNPASSNKASFNSKVD